MCGYRPHPAGFERALRRLKKIPGVSRRGSLTFAITSPSVHSAHRVLLTRPYEFSNVMHSAAGGHDLPRACRSCKLANAQLTLEPSLNNALSQIGQDFSRQLKRISVLMDSVVRVSPPQPASPVSVGDVQFAKIGATFPRVSETTWNLRVRNVRGLGPKTRVIVFDKLSEFAAATRTLWD